MLHESEPQFFAQGKKEKPEVSPEKTQKAIEYAKEIKEIKNKEFPTPEDKERLLELIEKIKRIYSPEKGDLQKAKTIVSSLKELLKEGADKKYVAQGLAGVGTKEAQEFRKKYFGDNPTLMAKSYSTGWSEDNGIICRYGWEN